MTEQMMINLMLANQAEKYGKQFAQSCAELEKTITENRALRAENMKLRQALRLILADDHGIWADTVRNIRNVARAALKEDEK